MKKFLYKHANKIFWIIVALDVFGFLSNWNIFSLLGIIFLLATYYFFKNRPKDYWFHVYYSTSSISGAIWFFYYDGVVAHLFLRGIVGFFTYALCTLVGYYYFKKKHNKFIAWTIFFISFFVAYFVAGQLHS